MPLSFSASLKQRLLAVTTGVHTVLDGNGLEVPHQPNNKPKLTDEEIIRRWQSRPVDSPCVETLRRKFLIRLATALHSYGSSASRTEYLIEKAASRLKVDVEIAVFPSLILLSFNNDSHQRPAEVHLHKVGIMYDVDKLGRADQLAICAGREDMHLFVALWRLKAIVNAPPEFGSLVWRLLGFSVSAGCAALIVFDGSLWDGLWALVLGLLVGLMQAFQPKSSIFANVFKFVASFCVSFLARLLTIYFTSHQVCYYAVALGSLIRVLPGLHLTLGVSDVVASAEVTGATRIISALISALEIGFGLATGDDMIFWVAKPPPAQACQPFQLPFHWNFIWFFGYTLSVNLLLHARVDQWAGMTLAAFIGWLVKSLADLRLSPNASTVISAFAIGVSGASYSYATGGMPLVTLLSGILFLLPGGIGVRGVTALLENDVLAGMGFVFDMVIVALAITLGLLLAKMSLPSAFFSPQKQLGVINPLGGDDSDTDEDMAI